MVKSSKWNVYFEATQISRMELFRENKSRLSAINYF